MKQYCSGKRSTLLFLKALMVLCLTLVFLPNSSAFSVSCGGVRTGIIIIDHGSKRENANLSLLNIVEKYKRKTNNNIVEPAHMEIAQPSIATAYENCIEQGANRIICHPYFLSKGRHVSEDIPKLVAEAATKFPDVTYVITEPLGVQDQIIDLIENAIISADMSISQPPMEL